jgi:hypothetical protein
MYDSVYVHALRISQTSSVAMASYPARRELSPGMQTDNTCGRNAQESLSKFPIKSHCREYF